MRITVCKLFCEAVLKQNRWCVCVCVSVGPGGYNYQFTKMEKNKSKLGGVSQNSIKLKIKEDHHIRVIRPLTVSHQRHHVKVTARILTFFNQATRIMLLNQQIWTNVHLKKRTQRKKDLNQDMSQTLSWTPDTLPPESLTMLVWSDISVVLEQPHRWSRSHRGKVIFSPHQKLRAGCRMHEAVQDGFQKPKQRIMAEFAVLSHL